MSKSSKMEGRTTRKLLGLILVMCTLPLSGALRGEKSEGTESNTEEEALKDMIAGFPEGTEAKYKMFQGYRPMYRTIDFKEGVEDVRKNRPLLTGIQENLKDLVKLKGGSKLATASLGDIDVLYAIHYPEIAPPTNKLVKMAHVAKNRATWLFKSACEQLQANMVARTHSRNDLKQFVHASYKHCIIAYFVRDKAQISMTSEKESDDSSSENTLMNSQSGKEKYLADLKQYLDILLKDPTITKLGARQMSRLIDTKT